MIDFILPVNFSGEPMKNISLKRKLFYLALGFITLFILRLSYGYLNYPNGVVRTTAEYTPSENDSFTLERRNYASSKAAAVKDVAATMPMSNVDQKYEKIGTLTSSSMQYEQDEKNLYELIKREQIMIQLERRAGLTPRRQLNIALGVVPDKFDKTIEELRQIGTLKIIQIDKNDKTNEYKKLEAERISLQKARDALLELKNGKAEVSDMISLTNQLLEIENKIQALGVNLGEFDENNEFCTVKFTLIESRETNALTIGFAHRIKTAFTWTSKAYFLFWLTTALGLLGLWLLAIFMEKISHWSQNKTDN